MAERRIPTREEVLSYLHERRNWGRWGKDDQVGALCATQSDWRHRLTSQPHCLVLTQGEDGTAPMAFTVHALAVTGAICSATATITFRQGLRHANTSTGFWINLVVGTVGLWAVVLLTGGFGRPSAAGVAFTKASSFM